MTFESRIPDDAEYSIDGENTFPPGRNISSAIASKLVEHGLEVSVPEQHRFYGWEFNAKIRNSNFWFLLQFPGPWLLISEDKSDFIKRAIGLSYDQSTVLSKLDSSMQKDVRFSNILWYDRIEYNRAYTMRGPRNTETRATTSNS
jgi:hypothetical protein